MFNLKDFNFIILNMDLCNLNNFNELKSKLESAPYYFEVREFKNKTKQNNDETKLDNLYLVYYTDKTEINSETRKYRGIILEKGSNKVVCRSYDKSYEYLTEDKVAVETEGKEESDKSEEEDYPEYDFKEATVEEMLDGTLIKLYYYDNQWNVATNRCIDAHQSRWGYKKNFYDLFSDASHNLDYTELKTDCTYSFVLCHPENRIVVRYNKPTLYLVAVRNNETGEFIEHNLTGITTPKRVTNFNSVEDLYSNTLKLPVYTPGYVIKFKLEQNNFCITKMKGKNYQRIHDLKGNERDLRLRYIQLRNNPNELNEFSKFFREVNFMKDDLEQLAKHIHLHYKTIHIDKLPFKTNEYFVEILKELHSHFIMTGEKIYLNVVNNFLEKMENDKLYHMYVVDKKQFHDNYKFRSP